jgi:hypothetical protein
MINIKKIKIPVIILSVVLVFAFVIWWQVTQSDKAPTRSNIFSFQIDSPKLYNQQMIITAGNFSLSFFPLSASASTQSVSDNSVRYSDAYPYTDVIQTKSYSRIKEEMILKQPGHPTEFKYQIDIKNYDWQFDDSRNLTFYMKGKAGDELSKLFTIPTPFLIDSNNVKSYDAVKMELKDNILTFTLDQSWLNKSNYPITLDPTVEINIINVHSHPQQGDNWTVNFTTQGQADLKIIPNDQSTIDDDDFVSLSCDGQNLTPQILSGDVIFYPNWECQGTGQVVHFTKTAGNHTLRFEFGDQVAYAYNSPPIITMVQKAPSGTTPTEIGGNPTGNVSFASLPSSGNLIVVMITANDPDLATFVINSVKDNQGNGNYSLAVSKRTTGGTGGAFIYYMKNIGQPRGTFTVTVTWNGDVYFDVGIMEIKGADRTNPVLTGNTNSAVGSSVSPSSGSVKPARDALYVGVMTGDSADFTSIVDETNWTQRWEELSYYQSAAMDVETYIGLDTQTATWTTPNQAWVAAITAFNAGGTTQVNSSRAVSVDSSGLVGYWSFDGKDTNWTSSTGGSAADLSGIGYTGTMTNMSRTTSPVPGISGQALKFNGSTNYVDTADIGEVDGSNYLTVSAWVYQYDTIAAKSVVSKWSNANPHFNLQTGDIGKGDGDDILVNVCSAGEDGYTTGGAHQARRWEHWVMVYDGTKSDNPGRLKLYLNGVEQSLTYSGSILTPTCSNDNHVEIGVDSDLGAGSFWNGLIDEVRIYDRALSASEVQQLYQAGASRMKANTSPAVSVSSGKSELVGYWSFDGANTNWTSATGGTTADLSGNNYTGTMHSMNRSTSPVPGISGQALNFNGNNNFVDTADVDITDTITVSAWIKPSISITSSFGYLGIVNKGRVTAWSFGHGGGNNDLDVRFNNTEVAATANNVYSPNVWTQVAFSYDKNAGSDQVKIYVNGVQTATGTYSTAIGTNSNKIAIGVEQDGGDYWPGAIDEVRVYSRALSASEVQQLYQAGLRRIKPTN